MQKFALGVVAVLLVGFSVAIAEDFGGAIKKVDGDKITVIKKKKGVKEGEEVTLTVAKDCKVSKGKFDKETKKLVAGDKIEDGLKNEMFSKDKIGEKGVGARFTTNDDGKVTEILIFGGKKKKDAN